MADGSTAPFTVVCFDDEPDILHLLQLAVSQEPDFEIVALAINSGAVLDLVARHRPDVLIVDNPHAPRSATRRGTGAGGPASSAGLVIAARALIPEATIVVFSGRESPDDLTPDLGDVWIQKPRLGSLWPAIRQARSEVRASSLPRTPVVIDLREETAMALNSSHLRPTPSRHFAPGVSVAVRSSDEGSWTSGYEIADIVRDDSVVTGYRLRRISDRRLLPAVFSMDDVIPAGR